jgi:hypothetical protein
LPNFPVENKGVSLSKESTDSKGVETISIAFEVNLTVEFDREEDGRWIAEILEIPGCIMYGRSKEEVRAKVISLARMVLRNG